jgi:hypothetical protein
MPGYGNAATVEAPGDYRSSRFDTVEVIKDAL